MKKNIAITLSTALIIISVIGILGTQFFSGGSNPINPIMFILLMFIGGGTETITFTVLRNNFLKIVPLMFTITIALWGTYLYMFSNSWVNATFTDLVCDYYSPMIGGFISIVLVKLFPLK